MKISELASATDVGVPTLKYYLREGVLHAGEVRSRTQASYDDSHVERVRLVRALTGVGGLSIAAVRRVLDVISDPGVGPTDVMAAAAASLYEPEPEPEVPEVRRAQRGASKGDDSSARELVDDLGWHIYPDDPALTALDEAWAACSDAGIGLDADRMRRYATSMHGVAETDVSSVPADPAGAVRQVVLGTVLVDPVLLSLRRLAQQDVAVRAGAISPPPTG
ncbi:MerR family transcriptional regulator [Janibacter melonis]|uniref:MerR family transcriptional regulator n=1 Tax=Janibacter melonis TaxID=262209 RepID=A0A5P8FQH6_9MICO|nr:MerR family transcriptional regulator [Janibacter melonis]QFQ31461.2 MerR family transcriptional regulator [Janibacter melonis]